MKETGKKGKEEHVKNRDGRREGKRGGVTVNKEKTEWEWEGKLERRNVKQRCRRKEGIKMREGREEGKQKRTKKKRRKEEGSKKRKPKERDGKNR